MHKIVAAVCFVVVSVSTGAWAQVPNLAPGFVSLPKGAKIVMMPPDIELFSISAGGVPEPRADWTEAGQRNFRSVLLKREGELGLSMTQMAEKDADEFSEISSLHTAIARAIALHHFGPAAFELPTKDGKLDWSLGDSTQALKKATGADYAMFTWVRDSHASAERQAAMVAIAVLSLGRALPRGGQQTAYASLVELDTGRILWFNRLRRDSGNIKDEADAAETVETLFGSLPVAK
jgi:hypothetical protein